MSLQFPNYNGIGIYSIRNYVTKSIYIGSSIHIKDRLKSHFKTGAVPDHFGMLMDIKMHPSSVFTPYIEKEIPDGTITLNELHSLENSFIKKYENGGWHTYNVVPASLSNKTESNTLLFSYPTQKRIKHNIELLLTPEEFRLIKSHASKLDSSLEYYITQAINEKMELDDKCNE